MKDFIARSRSLANQSEGAQLDAIADAFESALRDRAKPQIDDFLEGVSETLRPQLLKELIAVEIDFRNAAGEEVNIQEFLARYPDQSALVREAVELLDMTGKYSVDVGLDAPARSGAVTNDPVATPRPTPNSVVDSPTATRPRHIGRFRIEQELGSGAFGVVYLAVDPESNGKQVAIKVPHPATMDDEERRRDFQADARYAAQLDHPGIIRILEVEADQAPFFIVQEYMPGGDLQNWLKSIQPSCTQAVEMMIPIAEAVSFAHQHDIFHRDLKPANILLDTRGQPRVADFGLALHESNQSAHRGEWAGSPAYMSPEQVRYESHRLDGRSDIWALGVIFYEMLTGRRPFGGSSAELIDQIKYRDPRPPREINPELPLELERICLKCLAKRVTDRYSTASDIAEDLRLWLRREHEPDAKPSGSTIAPLMIPPGLRPFEADSRDYFLGLLPGPRHRSGLPESIQFWKSRIEEMSPDSTFAVGVIYGSSGCGKSSLVKAGLLPVLARHVTPIYVEAAPDDTEVRLVKGLRRRFPNIPAQISLPELLAGLREGIWTPPRRKTLLVLDQFEQWLHARRGEFEPQLLQALRHCDGGRLQGLLLVRDDFWGATSRFMRALEVPLFDGENQFFVDLFDLSHARRVLAEFGRAFGRLPLDLSDISPDQDAFLDSAVNGLAEEGKVACVRLSLFAEMTKDKPWTPWTWKQFGGVEELAVQYFTETFESANAPAAYRSRARPAQKVLGMLLPEVGTNIKGSRKSEEELMAASGHGTREFESLRRILDHDLRLITPTDPEGAERDSAPVDSSEGATRYYQLTHDYLVPSLRQWIHRKQKETLKGRAEMRLAERANWWQSQPQNRHLPAWWEYLSILALVPRKSWTGSQWRMMTRARRFHGRRAAILAGVMLLLAGAAYEANGRFQSQSLVSSLRHAKEEAVPAIVAQLDRYHRWAQPRLASILATPAKNADQLRQQLHARLALVRHDKEHVTELLEALLAAETSYFGIVRDALYQDRDPLLETLWSTLHDATAPPERRFRAGMALAHYDPGASQWSGEDRQFLVRQLVIANPEHQPKLREYLQPLKLQLLVELEALFAETQSTQSTQSTQPTESQQESVARAIADYARDDGPRLARLVAEANPIQYQALFPSVPNTPEAVQDLREIVDQRPTPGLTEEARIALGVKRAGAAITLLRHGRPADTLAALEVGDDPEAMTQFGRRCPLRRATPKQLLECLRLADSARKSKTGAERQAADRVLFGVLLALGEFLPDKFEAQEHAALVAKLRDWYAHDPSSAIHGATGWLLRFWRLSALAIELDKIPVPYDPQREWFTLVIPPRPEETLKSESGAEPRTIYLTFVVFPAGEYLIGSPEDEADRGKDESPSRVTLTRPFAILDRELMWGELEIFRPVFTQIRAETSAKPPSSAAGAAATWEEAAEFCRWLSQRAGQPEDDQFSFDVQSLDLTAGRATPLGNVPASTSNGPVRTDRPGFRLPTEAEWEIACRAGTVTRFGFGSDAGHLQRHGWFAANSKKQTYPPRGLRPNLRGVFDMHGNVFEWCHDWYAADRDENLVDPAGPATGSERIIRGGAWTSSDDYCRTANRDINLPSQRSSDLGFRIVFVPSEIDPGESNK